LIFLSGEGILKYMLPAPHRTTRRRWRRLLAGLLLVPLVGTSLPTPVFALRAGLEGKEETEVATALGRAASTHLAGAEEAERRKLAVLKGLYGTINRAIRRAQHQGSSIGQYGYSPTDFDYAVRLIRHLRDNGLLKPEAPFVELAGPGLVAALAQALTGASVTAVDKDPELLRFVKTQLEVFSAKHPGVLDLAKIDWVEQDLEHLPRSGAIDLAQFDVLYLYPPLEQGWVFTPSSFIYDVRPGALLVVVGGAVDRGADGKPMTLPGVEVVPVIDEAKGYRRGPVLPAAGAEEREAAVRAVEDQIAQITAAHPPTVDFATLQRLVEFWTALTTLPWKDAISYEGTSVQSLQASLAAFLHQIVDEEAPTLHAQATTDAQMQSALQPFRIEPVTDQTTGIVVLTAAVPRRTAQGETTGQTIGPGAVLFGHGGPPGQFRGMVGSSSWVRPYDGTLDTVVVSREDVRAHGLHLQPTAGAEEGLTPTQTKVLLARWVASQVGRSTVFLRGFPEHDGEILSRISPALLQTAVERLLDSLLEESRLRWANEHSQRPDWAQLTLVSTLPRSEQTRRFLELLRDLIAGNESLPDSPLAGMEEGVREFGSVDEFIRTVTTSQAEARDLVKDVDLIDYKIRVGGVPFEDIRPEQYATMDFLTVEHGPVYADPTWRDTLRIVDIPSAPRIKSGTTITVIVYVDDPMNEPIQALVAGWNAHAAQFGQLRFELARYPGEGKSVASVAIGVRPTTAGPYRNIPTLTYQSLIDLDRFSRFSYALYHIAANHQLIGQGIPVIKAVGYYDHQQQAYRLALCM